jgi:methionine synthase II (cobalamin-independent)
MNIKLAKPVHLVGSVSLASAKEVFESVGTCLGENVARIPDGETGERRLPYPFRKDLREIMAQTPGLEFKRDWQAGGVTFHLFGLAGGANANMVRFRTPLGWARAAIDSYEDFKAARGVGSIAQGIKMQVTMPTPFMLEMTLIEPASLTPLLPVFEDAMLRELKEITAAIPHESLAIQWDICPEFFVLEKTVPEIANAMSRTEMLSAIARITDSVPASVDVGWHFCYGDTGKYADDHETHHVVEPRDVGLMVAFANDLCALVKRSVNWVHMPVPRERDDQAYFAPLKDLKLKAGMQLFLGLVHNYDGLEGAKRRIAAARSFYEPFGVATECGMGRRPPEVIPELLRLHREIAESL